MSEVTVPEMPLAEAITALTGEAFDRIRAAAVAIRDADVAVVDARRRLSLVESEIAEAHNKCGSTNSALRDAEIQLAGLRADIQHEQQAFDQVYEQRKSEQGQLDTIRTQIQQLRQQLAG